MTDQHAENGHFQKALGNFVSDVAYAGAVRHMYASGMTVEEIRKNSLYPVTIEQIQRVIDRYEEEKKTGKDKVEFVKETDRYGRSSFRMVRKSEDGEA